MSDVGAEGKMTGPALTFRQPGSGKSSHPVTIVEAMGEFSPNL